MNKYSDPIHESFRRASIDLRCCSVDFEKRLSASPVADRFRTIFEIPSAERTAEAVCKPRALALEAWSLRSCW